MRFSRFGTAAAVLGVSLLASPVTAAQLEPAVVAEYSETSLAIPTVNLMVICHGFGCARRTPLALTAGDRAKLTQLVASGKKSLLAEQLAPANALTWLERRSGPLAGITRRMARLRPVAGDDAAGAVGKDRLKVIQKQRRPHHASAVV